MEQILDRRKDRNRQNHGPRRNQAQLIFAFHQATASLAMTPVL
jgi:hypothetical protein